MPTFGKESRENRDQCDPRLIEVLNEAIKHFDFSVICGYRGPDEQDELYRRGYSNARWGKSKHNHQPARAFDIIPYPNGWRSEPDEWYRQGTYILAAASQLGVRLYWGGHWENLVDMAHFELMDD